MHFFLPYGLAFLAQGLVRHGDQVVALAALREGLALADVTGEHFWDAELHRFTGIVLLAESKLDEGGPPFSTQSTLRKPNKRNRWNRAPPPASRASGATRASGIGSRTPCTGLRLVHRRLRTRDLKEAKALLGELRT